MRQVKDSHQQPLSLSDEVLKRQLVVLLFRNLNSNCALAAGFVIQQSSCGSTRPLTCVTTVWTPLWYHLLPIVFQRPSATSRGKLLICWFIIVRYLGRRGGEGFIVCIWILYLRCFCDYRCFTYKLLYIRKIFFSGIFKETSHSCVLHFNIFCIAELLWIAFCLHKQSSWATASASVSVSKEKIKCGHSYFQGDRTY